MKKHRKETSCRGCKLIVLRYLSRQIESDLKKKMVILGGPRQVGKTTLSLLLLQSEDEHHPAYLNWDNVQTRQRLMEGLLPADQPLIVLDEIHKYREWRNLVKGFYDTRRSKTQFLITGSARLDYYRKGGDSLMGRYYFYRLHPFSLVEVEADPTLETLTRLLEFGGFPEMYLLQDRREWKRWQKERVTRVIRDDLLSLELVKDVTQLELLASMLPDRVGSTLSIQSVAEDLQASHDAVSRWITILENVYYCFRIAPYSPPAHTKSPSNNLTAHIKSKSVNIKASKKNQKLYLWDWSTINSSGAKLENLLASNLLKYCHFLEDTEGDYMELMFLRDKEQRELDFIVVKNGQPLFAVECKSHNAKLSKSIAYFAQRTDIPIFYQVHLGEEDFEVPKFRSRIMPIVQFCKKVLQI